METPQERPPEESRPYGRRAFLGATALGLTSLFWGKTAWNAFTHAAGPLKRRPFVKDVHFDTGLAWMVAIVLIVVLGDRRGLRRTLRELDGFDRDDRLWLRRIPRPQGRFNAGQKLNAALTASFALLFAVSGVLLWYGERNSRFRFASTILLHDGLMYVSLVLLAGHLYLALIYPSTKHALRGMTTGSVRRDWARQHHSKWVDEQQRPRE